MLVTLLEMERFVCLAEEEDQGASTLVLDSAKAFERVSLPVVWTYATHFDFSSPVLRVLRGYFGHQRRFQFEGCVASRSGPSRPSSLGQNGAACSFAMWFTMRWYDWLHE